MMKPYGCLAVAISLCYPVFITAAPLLNGQVSGLAFGLQYAEVYDALRPHCAEIRDISITPPSFPLARSEERHLICDQYALNDQNIEQLALTFADDKLVLLQASGNAASAFLELAGNPSERYLHFTVSFADLLLADLQRDRVWIMSPEAAHPNLFQWQNPYALAKEGGWPNYRASAVVPNILEFGNTLESLQPLFQRDCQFVALDSSDVWLLNKPDAQQQLNCFGYEFAGFPRKIEAIFGDGILEQAWILTAKGEEDRVRKALITAFGEPKQTDKHWDVFGDGRIMLRKDKPEVLMLSDKLVPMYRHQIVEDGASR